MSPPLFHFSAGSSVRLVDPIAETLLPFVAVGSGSEARLG